MAALGFGSSIEGLLPLPHHECYAGWLMIAVPTNIRLALRLIQGLIDPWPFAPVTAIVIFNNPICHWHVGRGLLPAHPLLVEVDGCGQLGGLLDLAGRFLANVRVGLERCHYDVVDFAGFPLGRGIKRIENPLRAVFGALGDFLGLGIANKVLRTDSSASR
jgi:hypothetical protein